MKTKLAAIVVLALLAAAPFVHGQDTAGTEKKSTGTDMKDATKTAAKKTGSGVKKGVKATGHEVKKGTEKTVDAVK